jgi:hypothetical protein
MKTLSGEVLSSFPITLKLLRNNTTLGHQDTTDFLVGVQGEEGEGSDGILLRCKGRRPL